MAKNYIISVEVLKYPYCAESIESKEFLSEKICKKIVELVGKTRQTLCIVKLKTSKSICIIIVVTVLWGSMAQPIKAIGTTFVSKRTPITRLVHQKVYQKVKIAPTVNLRLDKIRMMATNNMIPLIYINGHYSYINEQLLKKL